MIPTAEFISQAIALAEKGEPGFVPPIPGFSSNKVRRLLNQLCRMEGARYLELGTHMGSTLISALHNNPDTVAACIDDYSMGGVEARAMIEVHIAEYLPRRSVLVLEQDLFHVPLELIPNYINVYFVDGPHDRNSHYAAFARLDPILDDTFVAVIDDWRWEEVRHGTQDAFRDLRYHVEKEWELPSDNERDELNWWNRLYVALIHKEPLNESTHLADPASISE